MVMCSLGLVTAVRRPDDFLQGDSMQLASSLNEKFARGCSSSNLEDAGIVVTLYTESWSFV